MFFFEKSYNKHLDDVSLYISISVFNSFILIRYGLDFKTKPFFILKTEVHLMSVENKICSGLVILSKTENCKCESVRFHRFLL